MKTHHFLILICIISPFILTGQQPGPLLSKANLERSIFLISVEKVVELDEKIPDYRGKEKEELDLFYKPLMELGREQGTGFCISHQGQLLIVTSYHVIWLADTSKKGSIIAKSSDGAKHSLRLLDYDPFYDLAILRFDQPDEVKPIPLEPATQMPVKNELVYAAGYPSQAFTVTSGQLVPTVNHHSTGRSVLTHTAPLDHGISGSPLLNSKLEYFGANIISTKNANLAMPLTNIQRLLQTMGQTHRRCFMGIELRENGEGMVYLKRVMPNSPASQYCRKYAGWQLKSIQEENIGDLSHALTILEATSPGEKISLSLQKPNTNQLITVSLPTIPLKGDHLEELGQLVLDEIGYFDENYPWKPNIINFKPNTDWHSKGFNENKRGPYLITLVGPEVQSSPETAWATPNLNDLGAAIRLSAFDGEIGLWLQDANDPGSQLKKATFLFTGADNCREKVLFY